MFDESAIISMGESCPAREMLDAEAGDDSTSDEAAREKPDTLVGERVDRKSTRLNSSH